MKVTLEQIDELRNRVNVSYEEAKSTLEKNDGDLIKSIIELEKKKGIKHGKQNKRNFTGIANKLLALRMSIKSKEGNTLLNVPLVLVLIAFMMAFWVVIFGLVVAIMTSCKIDIYRAKSMNVNDIKKNVQQTVDKIKVKSDEILRDEEEVQTEETENEIIIE